MEDGNVKKEKKSVLRRCIRFMWRKKVSLACREFEGLWTFFFFQGPLEEKEFFQKFNTEREKCGNNRAEKTFFLKKGLPDEGDKMLLVQQCGKVNEAILYFF